MLNISHLSYWETKATEKVNVKCRLKQFKIGAKVKESCSTLKLVLKRLQMLKQRSKP